ncbi:hypothetical protein ABT352_38730 [Streptosporangium sp. NPDC000563]
MIGRDRQRLGALEFAPLQSQGVRGGRGLVGDGAPSFESSSMPQ